MPVPFNDLRRAIGTMEPELEDALRRILKSGWFVLGEALAQFESAFAAHCGVCDCVGVANGTDAIEIALRALGVVPGDRVVCVANAGFYASTAVLAIGAQPTFVDIDPKRCCWTPIRRWPRWRAVRKRWSSHISSGGLPRSKRCCRGPRNLGFPSSKTARKRTARSEAALGPGAFGAVGCFSFYPTKNLGALGDGGACVTSDASLAKRIRALRQYGWAGKYRIETAGGRNSRLDEMQAALLAVRLPMLDANNARRREIAARYAARIQQPAVALPAASGSDDVAHLYVLRSASRDRLASHLRARGIGCDVHYPIPDHRQPAYRALFSAIALPQTERACGEVLSLPCFPELTDAEIDEVADAVNAFEPATAEPAST
jgi:dTDP-4-amino-4,6-dideoxygalactose transaminase